MLVQACVVSLIPQEKWGGLWNVDWNAHSLIPWNNWENRAIRGAKFMCPLHCLYTQEFIYCCKLDWLYKQQCNLFRVRSKRLGKEQWQNKKGIVKRRKVQRMQLYFCKNSWCNLCVLTYFIAAEFLCVLTMSSVKELGT